MNSIALSVWMIVLGIRCYIASQQATQPGSEEIFISRSGYNWLWLFGYLRNRVKKATKPESSATFIDLFTPKGRWIF